MTYKNKRILLLTSAICLAVLILSFFANRDDRFLGDYNPLLYGTLMIYNVIINFVLSSNEVSTNAAKRLLSIGKWSMPLFSLTYFFLSYTPATFPHVFDTEVFCSTFVGAILINVIPGIIALSPRVVCFCGGEPLLRYNVLPQLAQQLSEAGITVNMVTNGFLLDDEKIKTLRSSGISGFQISLDSAHEETHDYCLTLSQATQLQQRMEPYQTQRTEQKGQRKSSKVLSSDWQTAKYPLKAIAVFLFCPCFPVFPEPFAPTIPIIRPSSPHVKQKFKSWIISCFP